jgi:hypothetical protein
MCPDASMRSEGLYSGGLGLGVDSSKILSNKLGFSLERVDLFKLAIEMMEKVSRICSWVLLIW